MIRSTLPVALAALLLVLSIAAGQFSPFADRARPPLPITTQAHAGEQKPQGAADVVIPYAWEAETTTEHVFTLDLPPWPADAVTARLRHEHRALSAVGVRTWASSAFLGSRVDLTWEQSGGVLEGVVAASQHDHFVNETADYFDWNVTGFTGLGAEFTEDQWPESLTFRTIHYLQGGGNGSWRIQGHEVEGELYIEFVTE